MHNDLCGNMEVFQFQSIYKYQLSPERNEIKINKYYLTEYNTFLFINIVLTIYCFVGKCVQYR